MHSSLSPTTEKQRYLVLDALRGLALLGICLANMPEFGLWSFLSAEAQAALPSGCADRVVRFLQYVFIDAKFYGVFSILFGIGFSIILSHATQRGASGIRLFYRRMMILLLIAIAHLMLLWSGDILCLYAVAGMLLPPLSGLSDRRLLLLAVACMVIPVFLDLFQELSDTDFAAPLEAAWWSMAGRYGITEDNFAVWLRNIRDYQGLHAFLMQGAVERMWEFLCGHRLLRVVGLFLIGYVIGRRKMYAQPLASIPFPHSFGWAKGAGFAWLSLAIGLPLSVLYAISATSGHCWGLTIHSLLYCVSTLPMTLAYVVGFAWLCERWPDALPMRLLAKPGRMALTCYIGQSLAGAYIYYGIGLGLGLSMGLWQIELTALGVFAAEMVVATVWLRLFRYGPLEWVWRMLTYGRWLNPLKQ